MEVLGRRPLLPPARGRPSQGRHARRADAEGGARPARHDPERHGLEAGVRKRDGLGPRPARPARGDAPEDGGACGREPLHDGRRLRHVPLRRPERRGPRALAMGRLRRLPQLRDRVPWQPDGRRVPHEQLLRPGRDIGARGAQRGRAGARRRRAELPAVRFPALPLRVGRAGERACGGERPRPASAGQPGPRRARLDWLCRLVVHGRGHAAPGSRALRVRPARPPAVGQGRGDGGRSQRARKERCERGQSRI